MGNILIEKNNKFKKMLQKNYKNITILQKHYKFIQILTFLFCSVIFMIKQMTGEKSNEKI